MDCRKLYPPSRGRRRLSAEVGVTRRRVSLPGLFARQYLVENGPAPQGAKASFRFYRAATLGAGRGLLEHNHRADDIASFHLMEGVLDIADSNSSRDHAVQVQLALKIKLGQQRKVV